MTRKDFIRKIASRKFWAMLAGFVSGLVMAFGCAANTSETISGLIVSFGSIVVYMLAESSVDAANKPTYGADEHVEPPPDTVEE